MTPPIRNARFAYRIDHLLDGQTARLDDGVGSVIVLVKSGDVHCYANRCPHQGTELDWAPGVFVNPSRDHLQCATHGALFSMTTGLCISGPCKGESLTRIESRVENEFVYIFESL